MKRILCVLLCAVMVLLLVACNKNTSGRSEHSLLGEYKKSENIPEYDFMSGEDIMPEDYEKYSQGMMDFSFSLLSSSAKNGNTVVSPVSVSNVLSLLLNGANTSTAKEIRQTMGMSDTELINTGNHYLISRLNAFNGEESSFKSADSLWFDDSFDVKAAFLQTAVDYYNAEVMRVDLADKDTEGKINEWVSDNTDGEIPDLIKNLDKDIVMLLVNAVLMQDEWAIAYTEDQLQDGVFNGTEGESDVVYMSSDEHYISSSYAKGFVKGFKNLPLKFVALLPEGDVTAEEFTENLTSARWQELLASQQATSFCAASLPEFSFGFDADLTDSLKAMGINKAFDSNKADFSQLSNTRKPYVSKVQHNAFIEIGPMGAKAGAATVAEMKDTSALVEIPVLKFDRPFVFVICDNESNIPVFAGIVNNITK